MGTGLQFINNLQASIVALLTQNAGFLQPFGMAEFRALAAIVIIWFGYKWAISGMTVAQGFAYFSDLMMNIAICYAMLAFYNAPMPFAGGMNFHQLITAEPLAIAHRIGSVQAQQMATQLANFWSGIEIPGITNVLGMMCYVVATVEILLCAAVGLVVISWGFVASAVLILIGPVLIPFFIFPSLSRIFWGWFMSFLSYAFYPAIASAVIWVIGNALLLEFPANGFVSITDLVNRIVSYSVMLVPSAYAIIKIPDLVNHLFSGGSGSGLGSLLAGFFGGSLK